MGVVVNAVRDLGAGLGQSGVGASLGVAGEAGAIGKWAGNAASSLGAGSATCPLVSEFRDIGAGIAQGNFQRVVLGAGVLSLAVAPGAGSAAGGIKPVHTLSAGSVRQAAMAAGVYATGQVLANGIQQLGAQAAGSTQSASSAHTGASNSTNNQQGVDSAGNSGFSPLYNAGSNAGGNCGGSGGKSSPATTSHRPKSFDEVKGTILADEGVFKFIKIDIKCPKTFKTKALIRGYGDDDILETFLRDELADCPEGGSSWAIKCSGGGTMKRTNTDGEKRIAIYGHADLRERDLQEVNDVVAQDPEFSGYQVSTVAPPAKEYQKVLREDTLHANVKDCQYAVRGAIPLRGGEINRLIAAGEKFPFKKTTPCNIGNPQAVGQGVMTFNREVLSGALYPALLETDALSEDAKARARLFTESIASPMGAYTGNSKGFDFVRKAVAKFIEERDGPAVKANVDNIYLTNGASEGVRQVFKLLLRDQLDGVLVPIPQYPLYSALLTLQGATLVKYFLDEDKNWGVDAEEIEARIKGARDLGVRPRAITVINPGNPTGQVLKRGDIEAIIKIAYEHQMVILADEVYQNNIYLNVPFISFRKVLAEMGAPYSNNVELISLHSTSKGLLGECGLRGGYMETVNLDPYVEKTLYKLKSIELCSNTPGQLCTYLLAAPPKAGQESDACVALYEKEKAVIADGLRERAHLLTKTFNEMENVSAQPIQGAMYGFAKVEFSEKAIQAATAKGMTVDSMYCLDMVNQTGIMTVPGSGFGQVEGTYHFRMTNLVCPTSVMATTLESLRKFNSKFHAKYA